jgi:hypothetical protein
MPAEASVDIRDFVKKYSQEIGCAVQESDVNNIFSRTHKTKNNKTKTKIVLEFTTLKERKDFSFAGREHRFNKQQRGGGYRFVKVVDTPASYMKAMFFSIAENRMIHKDVVKNVWVSDGEIFVRRYETDAVVPVKDMVFAELLFPPRSVA